MFEFEDVIRSANMYLAVKDKSLKYHYCNENLACGLGLDSPKQIIGKDDHQLFRESYANLYHLGDNYVLKGGIFLNKYEEQPHVNKRLQILTTKNLLKKKDSTVSGIVVSFIDITGLNYKPQAELLAYEPTKNAYEFHVGKQTDFFTKREYQVFRCILMGLTAKQIAKRLAISPRTVEDHINKIKLKLQCGSKYQIAETAIRMGIVQRSLLDDINFP
jgi:DNA-binding CsgD family transcriptional regulator